MSHTLTHANHLKEIRKKAGVKVPRKRRSRIPRQVYPRLIEHEYSQAIAEVTGRAARRTLQPLLSELPSLLESARQSRADSGDEGRMFAGFNVCIENPKGSVRYWRDSGGAEGETTMKWDYGYIDGFIGADGDEVDVYLGPDDDSPWAHIIHQMKKDPTAEGRWREYDEDKVMIGWRSADDAKAAYLSQYDDIRFFGSMTTMCLSDLRNSLRESSGGPITARLDADEGRKARKLIDKAKAQMSSIGADKVEALGRKFAELTSSHQRKMIQKQTRAALGVDVTFRDKGLAAKMAHFVDENASLISTMQTNVHDDVAKIVTRAIVNGELHDEVAKEIEKRFGVSESHAKLIARDQIGKLYGQLNAARSRELGLKRFIWRSVGDERVRDEHTKREEDSNPDEGGTPYYFDDPPDGELPGVPIQCRCTAEPVFDFEEEPDEAPASKSSKDEENTEEDADEETGSGGEVDETAD